MKKVILRIVVAAIAIALIVLVLMNTVFKTPSTIKVYNELNQSLAGDGQITKLSQGLNTEFEEFKNKYGDLVTIFNGEIVTLQEYYSKLYYLKDVDDKNVAAVLDKMEQLKKSLANATNKINDIVELSKTNPSIDKLKYVEEIRPDLINSLDCISSVNSVIIDFLVANYYGGNYGEYLFLSKVKTEIAREYFLNMTRAKETYDVGEFNYSENLDNVASMYALLTISGKGGNTPLYADDIQKLNNLYDLMDKAKSINIGRVITDFKAYTEENKLVNEADKKDVNKVDKLKTIGLLAAQLNDIGKMEPDVTKQFAIRDSAGFVIPELLVEA